MNSYKNSVKVYDPGLATVLLLGGYPMLYSGMEPNGQMIFGFTKSDRIEKIIDQYWDNEITIKARDFYDHAQMLIGAAYGARVLG
jgi:hypothetical protein